MFLEVSFIILFNYYCLLFKSNVKSVQKMMIQILDKTQSLQQ